MNPPALQRACRVSRLFFKARKIIPILLIPMLSLAPLHAEPTPPPQEIRLVAPPGGGIFVTWYGKLGRSYFLQISDPADHRRVSRRQAVRVCSRLSRWGVGWALGCYIKMSANELILADLFMSVRSLAQDHLREHFHQHRKPPRLADCYGGHRRSVVEWQHSQLRW